MAYVCTYAQRRAAPSSAACFSLLELDVARAIGFGIPCWSHPRALGRRTVRVVTRSFPSGSVPVRRSTSLRTLWGARSESSVDAAPSIRPERRATLLPLAGFSTKSTYVDAFASTSSRTLICSRSERRLPVRRVVTRRICTVGARLSKATIPVHVFMKVISPVATFRYVPRPRSVVNAALAHLISQVPVPSKCSAFPRRTNVRMPLPSPQMCVRWAVTVVGPVSK